MQRRVLLIVSIIAGTILGCKSTKKGEAFGPGTTDATASYYESADYESNPQTLADDPVDAWSKTANSGLTQTGDAYADSAYTRNDTSRLLTTTSSGRYHSVVKKDTLFSLARHYYQNQSKWRDIYDANRSTIGDDPNRIFVGQKLLIP